MGIAALRHVLKAFSGNDLSPDESGEFVKEVLVMTLARVTKSDSNIAPIEVSTARRVIRDATGEDLSDADIRVAASSALFESESLESALAGLRHALKSADRAFIASGLAEVIRSDSRINESELDFFDAVTEALEMRPSEIAGLFVPPRAAG
jgi:uncharacterized tellurite resistance protein B-like protein